jgi:penicillin amidase
MRFVADLSNFDGSLMNVTTGESGHFLSPNYKDQFPAWYEGRGIPSAFSDAAEQAKVAHKLRLVPAAQK